MTTLAEIENAVAALPREEKLALYRSLQVELRESPPSHGVLDIAPVNLGVVLKPLDGDDDLLAEMLGERA